MCCAGTGTNACSIIHAKDAKFFRGPPHRGASHILPLPCNGGVALAPVLGRYHGFETFSDTFPASFDLDFEPPCRCQEVVPGRQTGPMSQATYGPTAALRCSRSQIPACSCSDGSSDIGYWPISPRHDFELAQLEHIIEQHVTNA